MEASFLSHHSFAQRPNCFSLEFTPLGWILWSWLFLPPTLNMKLSSNQKSLPSLCASGFISLPHIHNHNILSTTNSKPCNPAKGLQPSQPPPQGLPRLCQDPGSSPSLYSKLTIIFSVHLTCLKNQLLQKLVNIN